MQDSKAQTAAKIFLLRFMPHAPDDNLRHKHADIATKNTEIRQRNILSKQYDLEDQETHLLKPIPKSKPIDEYNLSLVTIYVESCESDSIFTVETIFRTI